MRDPPGQIYGHAETPFGIRAMQELDKLNPRPGTATDLMALFLAINTSSPTLLPTGAIALRMAAGSAAPAGILPTTGTNRQCAPRTLTLAVLSGNLPSVLCAQFIPTKKREGWTDRVYSPISLVLERWGF
jgi:hypothetical protein